MDMDTEEQEERTKCEVCISGCKQVTTFTLSHIGLLTLVVCYCMAGAAIFESLEVEHEIMVKQNVTKMRRAVAYDLWNMTHGLTYIKPENWSAYASERLKEFETELVKAMRNQGWDGNEAIDVLNWNKLGALFYSVIVITTIGYGHIAPKTMWGKIVTMFYAIIGIPLMVVCWSHIGDFLANSFRVIYWKVCCYICTRNPPPQRGGSGRSRRSVRSRGAGSVRMKSRSIRRSVRASQRSADSAVSVDSMNSIVSDPGVMHMDSSRYQRSGPPQRNQSHSATLPRTTQPRGVPHPGRYLPRSTKSAEPETMPSPSSLKNLPVLYNRYAEDLPLPYRKPHQPVDIDEEDEEEEDEPMPMPVSRLSRSRMRSAPPESRYAPPEEIEYWDEDEDEEDDFDECDEENVERRPVPIWLCSLLVIGYIVGGAFLFHSWEEWSMLDSAYFCFITLTTIGFGDFVPKTIQEGAEVSVALCSLYLLFGIALLAMSFNLVQEQVITAFKDLALRLGILNEDET